MFAGFQRPKYCRQILAGRKTSCHGQRTDTMGTASRLVQLLFKLLQGLSIHFSRATRHILANVDYNDGRLKARPQLELGVTGWSDARAVAPRQVFGSLRKPMSSRHSAALFCPSDWLCYCNY
jgi:hypothetical protein